MQSKGKSAFYSVCNLLEYSFPLLFLRRHLLLRVYKGLIKKQNAACIHLRQFYTKRHDKFVCPLCKKHIINSSLLTAFISRILFKTLHQIN